MASKLEKLRAKHAANMLDENQLDAVAGGNYTESMLDTQFLNVLMQGMEGQPPSMDIYFVVGHGEPCLKRAWSKLGVEFKFGVRHDPNEYSIDGKKVSREDAMNHAMEVVGKHITEKDWMNVHL